MHLWPSMRLRDSFKIESLKNLEWNLLRMNSERKQQQDTGSSRNDGNQQSLLNDSNKDQIGKFISVCKELLLILSCCYCCFCCGACFEDDG